MRKCTHFFPLRAVVVSPVPLTADTIFSTVYNSLLCCRLITPKCMGLIAVGSGSGRCRLLKHSARSWSECQPGIGKAGSWGPAAEPREGSRPWRWRPGGCFLTQLLRGPACLGACVGLDPWAAGSQAASWAAGGATVVLRLGSVYWWAGWVPPRKAGVPLLVGEAGSAATAAHWEAGLGLGTLG